MLVTNVVSKRCSQKLVTLVTSSSHNQEDEATEINLSFLQEELHKIRLTQLDTTEQQDPRNLPHFDFQGNIFWHDESFQYVINADIYQATLTAYPMTLLLDGTVKTAPDGEPVLIAGVDTDEQDFEASFAKEAFRSINQYLNGVNQYY